MRSGVTWDFAIGRGEDKLPPLRKQHKIFNFLREKFKTVALIDAPFRMRSRPRLSLSPMLRSMYGVIILRSEENKFNREGSSERGFSNNFFTLVSYLEKVIIKPVERVGQVSNLSPGPGNLGADRKEKILEKKRNKMYIHCLVAPAFQSQRIPSINKMEHMNATTLLIFNLITRSLCLKSVYRYCTAPFAISARKVDFKTVTDTSCYE